MKKSRFTDSQIIDALKRVEAGLAVPELCRELGISTATFYKWRSKFGGMDASLMARMKELQPEMEALRAACPPGEVPDADLPEVAFAGRSNVGKSSLLNALTGRQGLARTSNTPGRTQELNLFLVGEPPVLRLVDMPGYGYAEAPKDLIREWGRLVNDYLRGRPTLKRVLVLVDSRHGLKPVDKEIMELLDKAAVSYQVVLTKGDALKKGQVESRLAGIQAALAKRPAAYPELILTSSRDDLGVAEEDVLGPQRHRPQARAADLVEAPGRAFLRQAGEDVRLPGRVLTLVGGEDLAEDGLATVRVVRAQPADLGLQAQRHRRHRQHPTPGLQQPADQVEPGDGVVVQLPQRDDEQVADGVPGQRALTGEAVLQQLAPGVPPLGVVAERGQRHPQVAGRQHLVVGAQPAAGAAVVGDGDHRGEVLGQQPERGQRGGQTVAAAERDDLGVTGLRGHLTPSPGRGGRRRWTPRRRPGARPAPRPWPPSGACRRCTPPRA